MYSHMLNWKWWKGVAIGIIRDQEDPVGAGLMS